MEAEGEREPAAASSSRSPEFARGAGIAYASAQLRPGVVPPSLGPGVAAVIGNQAMVRLLQRSITGGTRGQEVEHTSGKRYTITGISVDADNDTVYELTGARGEKISVYGDVATYRLIESEGLAELFGRSAWRGTAAAGSNPTKADFAGLRHAGRIKDDELLALIPSDAENQFAFEPRSQRGFKFEWNNWHVHGHEPDAGAAAGHVGAAGWVVRIQDRTDGTWLLANQWAPGGPNPAAPTDWSRSRSHQVAALSHIPLDV